MLKIIIFLVVSFIIVVSSSNETVDIGLEITTTLGLIKGFDLKDGKVRGFLGIPYAEAPLKEKRFMPAIPHKPWTEPKETKHWLKKCLPFRRNFYDFETYAEDCLYLSILVPAKVHKTNLLVFFSNENLNVVRLLDLIKREVAIAVVYFREGLTGYASLDPETGSYGIEDIKIALEFIEKNAKNFGITEKIILVGENDGASALHLAFNSWKKDAKTEHTYQLCYFHLVLLNGNKNIERFASDFERVKKNTHALMKEIDCDIPSSKQSFDCARTKTFTEIIKAYQKLELHEEYGAPFRPISATFETSVSVPSIIGLEKTLSSFYYQTVEEFNVEYNYTNFKILLARIISDKKYKNGALIRRLIWHEYIRSIGDKKDTYFLWQQGRQILLDKNYNAPTVKLIQEISSETNDVFLFKYMVPNPISTCLGATIPEFQQKFCDQWHKFLLRFVTKGSPTQRGCEEGKVKWPSLNSGKREYFITLDDEGKIEWDFNFNLKADAFWNDLVPMMEKLELKGKRAPANEDDIELLHPLEEEDDIQQFHQEPHTEF
jgi:carboxylesterase type B